MFCIINTEMRGGYMALAGNIIPGIANVTSLQAIALQLCCIIFLL